jgi:putative transposase
MPVRKTILADEQTYHIFNRGVDHRPIFTNKREYQYFLKELSYYRFVSPPLRLSLFLELSAERRNELLFDLNKKKRKAQVAILAFCLMPNHFHLLLRQTSKDGISNFMGKIQNSYTKYFNIGRSRIGSLFQGRFKAVRAETDEQLTHLSRYIHLNPYSSFIVKDVDNLCNYPWSSFSEYNSQTDGEQSFVDKKTVLGLFKNKERYLEFVLNQADYQKSLEIIKHLTHEDSE